jgi:hypothetical protein
MRANKKAVLDRIDSLSQEELWHLANRLRENCSASSARVLSPLIAASTTLAVNPGKWFRLLRLIIFSCGDLNYRRIYTYATVSNPGPTSIQPGGFDITGGESVGAANERCATSHLTLHSLR